MRNWTMATLIAVIILTSPFTFVGMSIVGGVIVYGPDYMEVMQGVAERLYYGEPEWPR